MRLVLRLANAHGTVITVFFNVVKLTGGIGADVDDLALGSMDLMLI